jgi:hypothetical protein
MLSVPSRLADFLIAAMDYDKFAEGLKVLIGEVNSLQVAVTQDIGNLSRKCISGKSVKLAEALERQAKLEKDSELLVKIHGMVNIHDFVYIYLFNFERFTSICASQPKHPLQFKV